MVVPETRIPFRTVGPQQTIRRSWLGYRESSKFGGKYPEHNRSHSHGRYPILLLKWLAALVILLITVRIMLPFAVAAYVNRILNETPDYSGRIGGVKMRLWQGGYQIGQIQILKKNGQIKSPLFSAARMDLSIEWSELFHGAIVGKVFLQQPEVNFVSGPTKDQTQTGSSDGWDATLKSLFPFNLNRLEITNGEIHFQNQFSKPPVDIYLSKISAVATNLTNTRGLNQKLPSGLVASGSTIGGGQLNLQLQMNLLKPTPAYELNCGLTNVNLVALNSFLRAYGSFDVARGNFALFTSVAGDGGNYNGYFKVFFGNLEVFQWEKDKKKNIVAVFWQAIVGGVTTVFKNHPKDQLATKVPISGSDTGSKVGIWTATATILENAFIHALVPKLDQHVSVDQVDKTIDNK
jgi:hypothetical protein